jgi:hypothetical protein
LELNWSSTGRNLIHFADAPCHGEKYHYLSDNYPGENHEYGLDKSDIQQNDRNGY